MPLIRLLTNKVKCVYQSPGWLKSTSFHFMQKECSTYTHLQSIHRKESKRSLKTSVSIGSEEEKGRLSKRTAENFNTLGSWNNRIDMSINLEHSIKHGTLIPEITTNRVSVVSLIGRRDKNEDRYKIKRLAPDILMFAIFDGHGGALAADFTSTRMEDHIKFWLGRGETDLQNVLYKSFIALNNAFTQLLYNEYVGHDQAMSSGTTATVCLLRKNVELVVAHVGDSKALMCRSGKVVRLTKDHKPNDAKEKERIINAGGKITTPSLGRARVNSVLDMSRSIGDVELKAYGVTCIPDTRSIEVKHGKDAFLVLSTDGINYVINDQEVIDIVCRCEDPDEAAKMLTDQAMHFGTEDNATAIIIPFGAWGKYANTASTVSFSFGRNIISRRFS